MTRDKLTIIKDELSWESFKCFSRTRNMTLLLQRLEKYIKDNDTNLELEEFGKLEVVVGNLGVACLELERNKERLKRTLDTLEDIIDKVNHK